MPGNAWALEAGLPLLKGRLSQQEKPFSHRGQAVTARERFWMRLRIPISEGAGDRDHEKRKTCRARRDECRALSELQSASAPLSSITKSQMMKNVLTHVNFGCKMYMEDTPYSRTRCEPTPGDTNPSVSATAHASSRTSP